MMYFYFLSFATLSNQVDVIIAISLLWWKLLLSIFDVIQDVCFVTSRIDDFFSLFIALFWFFLFIFIFALFTLFFLFFALLALLLCRIFLRRTVMFGGLVLSLFNNLNFIFSHTTNWNVHQTFNRQVQFMTAIHTTHLQCLEVQLLFLPFQLYLLLLFFFFLQCAVLAALKNDDYRYGND